MLRIVFLFHLRARYSRALVVLHVCQNILMEKAVDCSEASQYKYRFSKDWFRQWWPTVKLAICKLDSYHTSPSLLVFQVLHSTMSFQCCVCVLSSYSLGPIETHFSHYSGSICTNIQGLLLVFINRNRKWNLPWRYTYLKNAKRSQMKTHYFQPLSSAAEHLPGCTNCFIYLRSSVIIIPFYCNTL